MGSFSFSPTWRQFQFISVTSGFTRLSMKTKYVCRGLISLNVNFHNNRTMWSKNLHVKICRWGEKEKEPFYGVTSGLTSLNMKIECVWYILISPHVKFHNDRTKWTVTSLVKKLQVGGKGKRAKESKILAADGISITACFRKSKGDSKKTQNLTAKFT